MAIYFLGVALLSGRAIRFDKCRVCTAQEPKEVESVVQRHHNPGAHLTFRYDAGQTHTPRDNRATASHIMSLWAQGPLLCPWPWPMVPWAKGPWVVCQGKGTWALGPSYLNLRGHVPRAQRPSKIQTKGPWVLGSSSP